MHNKVFSTLRDLRGNIGWINIGKLSRVHDITSILCCTDCILYGMMSGYIDNYKKAAEFNNAKYRHRMTSLSQLTNDIEL